MKQGLCAFGFVVLSVFLWSDLPVDYAEEAHFTLHDGTVLEGEIFAGFSFSDSLGWPNLPVDITDWYVGSPHYSEYLDINPPCFEVPICDPNHPGYLLSPDANHKPIERFFSTYAIITEDIRKVPYADIRKVEIIRPRHDVWSSQAPQEISRKAYETFQKPIYDHIVGYDTSSTGVGTDYHYYNTNPHINAYLLQKIVHFSPYGSDSNSYWSWIDSVAVDLTASLPPKVLLGRVKALRASVADSMKACRFERLPESPLFAELSQYFRSQLTICDSLIYISKLPDALGQESRIRYLKLVEELRARPALYREYGGSWYDWTDDSYAHLCLDQGILFLYFNTD